MLYCACKQQVNWCSAHKGDQNLYGGAFNFQYSYNFERWTQGLKYKYIFHYPIFSMREKLSLDQRNIMNESPSSECFNIKVKIPYAHHYKPRFVYFLPTF